MNQGRTPDNVSHEDLLAALECKLDFTPERTVYETQLRHRLMTLARKARLEVAAHELTGLPARELQAKTTTELLILLEKHPSGLAPGLFNLYRYWW